MPEPRKIFRIEEKAVSRLGELVTDAQAPLRHAELMQEITALRAMLAAMAQPPSDGFGAPRNGTTVPGRKGAAFGKRPRRAAIQPPWRCAKSLASAIVPRGGMVRMASRSLG